MTTELKPLLEAVRALPSDWRGLHILDGLGSSDDNVLTGPNELADLLLCFPDEDWTGWELVNGELLDPLGRIEVERIN